MIFKLYIKWIKKIIVIIFLIFLILSMKVIFRIDSYIGYIPYKVDCKYFIKNKYYINNYEKNRYGLISQLNQLNNGLGYIIDYESCPGKKGLIILYDNNKNRKKIIEFIGNNNTFYGIPYTIESIYRNNTKIDRFSTFGVKNLKDFLLPIK